MRDNKMRRKMADSFLSALKEDVIPWERGWDLEEAPQNATTGNRYRGSNHLWLNYVAKEQGYSDPRWCTFIQAKEKGWRIKKGEKGTQIEFFTHYDKKKKKNITYQEAEQLRDELSKEDYAERIMIFTKNSTVFNAEQIEGIPAREKRVEKFPADQLLKQRNVLLKNMNLKFEEGGDQASYSPRQDRIRMPKMEQFHDAYGYMATFLHEAAHATGHPTRLHREQSFSKGSPGYAREELRAEIASAFTAQELGTAAVTEKQMQNHKAYIQDWVKILEKEPEELFAAVREAQGISDYLIEKGEFHSLDLAQETALEQELLEHQEETGSAEIQKEAGVEIQKESARADKSATMQELERQKDQEPARNPPAENQEEARKENAREEDRERNPMQDGRVEILGLYEWNEKDMVYYRKDSKNNLTDGITIIDDVDPIIVHSIPGIAETDGIDSKLFAEKVQWHHPELHFSESQLKWIDKGTEKHSIIPPEENGIEVLGLYEKNGQDQYVHYTYKGEEYLSDGKTKHYNREKIQHVLSGEGMERAASLDRDKFMEKMGALRYFEPEKRLLDSLGTMEQDGAVKMPMRPQNTPEEQEKNAQKKTAALYEDIQELASAEEKLGIPEEDRLTAWAGDYAYYEAKLGIPPEEIHSRLEEYSGMQSGNELEELDNESQRGNREAVQEVLLTPGYARASEEMAAMILDRNSEVPLYCYSHADGISQKISEMPEEREGKVFIVNKNAFYSRKDFFPSITCEWSESSAFTDNTIYSVSEFDTLMESADRELCGKQKKIVGKYGDLDTAYEKATEEEFYDLGYRKVKFTIDTRQGDSVIHKPERQDIGDGDGSVINFLSQFPSYQMEVRELKQQAEIERKLENSMAEDGLQTGHPIARAADRNTRRRGR